MVTELNYGYAHTKKIGTGSFLTLSQIGSALIQNVEFSYNFAICYAESGFQGYILNLQNFLGTVTISQCNFLTNYVDSLIYIDTSLVVYNDLREDTHGVCTACSQKHFVLENVIITTLYSAQDVITYYMRQTAGHCVSSIVNGKIDDEEYTGSFKSSRNFRENEVQIIPLISFLNYQTEDDHYSETTEAHYLLKNDLALCLILGDRNEIEEVVFADASMLNDPHPLTVLLSGHPIFNDCLYPGEFKIEDIKKKNFIKS